MRVWILFLVSIAAIRPGPVEAQRAGAPRLGVDGLVLFRSGGSVAVLAVATPFWRAVSTRSEELLGDFRYLPEYAATRSRGQIFEVLRSDPRGEHGVGSVRSSGAGRFLAVPWTFGPGCAEEGWGSADWVPPGDTVAFLLEPTRASTGEEGGLPVFDVLGWHQPYPVGELIPFWRRDRQTASVWLTAAEFYELVRVLPSESAFRADPSAATAPFLDWVRMEPGRASAFPVAEILAEWRGRGEDSGGGR